MYYTILLLLELLDLNYTADRVRIAAPDEQTSIAEERSDDSDLDEETSSLDEEIPDWAQEKLSLTNNDRNYFNLLMLKWSAMRGCKPCAKLVWYLLAHLDHRFHRSECAIYGELRWHKGDLRWRLTEHEGEISTLYHEFRFNICSFNEEEQSKCSPRRPTTA